MSSVHFVSCGNARVFDVTSYIDQYVVVVAKTHIPTHVLYILPVCL